MIIVTGATGFLGPRLLARLLTRPEPITLVTNRGSRTRPEDVQEALREAGCAQDLVRQAAGRMMLVDVDLTAPRLGLERPEYERLARGATEIWHAAASTNLSPHAAGTRRVNLEGTRNILGLASATAALGGRPPALRYVSTAFVAGGRSDGVVGEADLTDAFGFVNPYEESKYQAERLVRAWADREGASAAVLRPSILVDDRPAPARRPHTLQSAVDVATSVAGDLPEGPARIPIRVPGSPDAVMNLMPVDRAAELMIGLAARHTGPGAWTFHITHPEDVPVPTVAELFERLLPVRIDLVPQRPAAPTVYETLAYEALNAFIPYCSFRRRYDRTAGGLDTAVPRVDVDYLLRGTATPGSRRPGPHRAGALTN